MTGAGQHDADRILAEISGNTIEELVDWRCLARDVGCEVSQLQPALLQGCDVTGRNDVDSIRFNQVVIPRLGDRHLGPPADDFGEQAFAVSREMQDDDEH